MDPVFVEHYRRLARAAFRRNDRDHYREMKALGFMPGHLDPAIVQRR